MKGIKVIDIIISNVHTMAEINKEKDLMDSNESKFQVQQIEKSTILLRRGLVAFALCPYCCP